MSPSCVKSHAITTHSRWLSDHQGMMGGNRSRYCTVTRDTARTERLSTTLQDLTRPYYHSKDVLVKVHAGSNTNTSRGPLSQLPKGAIPHLQKRIIIDKTGCLTTNPRQPKDAKWSLTGPLESKGPVRYHLAASGCLGFVVRQPVLSMMILIANVG